MAYCTLITQSWRVSTRQPRQRDSTKTKISLFVMDSLVVVNSRLQQKDDGSVENAVLVIQDDDGKEEDDSLDDCSFSVSSSISRSTLSSTSSWQDVHDVKTVSGSWDCSNQQKFSEKGDDDQSWSVVDDDDEDASDGPPISTTELSSFRDGKDSTGLNVEVPLATPVADTTTTSTGGTMTATTMDASQPTTTTTENSTCKVCGAEIPESLPVKDVRGLHDADDACKPFPPNMKKTKKECGQAQQELVEKLASIAVDPTLFATLGAFPSPFMQPRLARFRNTVGVASAAKPSPTVAEQQPSVASCDATSSPKEDPTRLSSLENVKVAAKAVDGTETTPKSGVDNRKDTPFGLGGIAAAAALAHAKAAAKTRQLALVHNSDNEKKSLSAGGGSRPKEIRRRRKSPFAVVAAASTPVAKTKSSEASGRSQKHPFAIAAAAKAAVAQSRQREINRRSSESSIGVRIAAAAAKAGKSKQREINRRSSKSSIAGSGIAAAAAKAAAAKSKQREINRRSSKSRFASRVFAAAAAKAAATKGKKIVGASGHGSVACGKIGGAVQVQVS